LYDQSCSIVIINIVRDETVTYHIMSVGYDKLMPFIIKHIV